MDTNNSSFRDNQGRFFDPNPGRYSSRWPPRPVGPQWESSMLNSYIFSLEEEELRKKLQMFGKQKGLNESQLHQLYLQLKGAEERKQINNRTILKDKIEM